VQLHGVALISTPICYVGGEWGVNSSRWYHRINIIRACTRNENFEHLQGCIPRRRAHQASCTSWSCHRKPVQVRRAERTAFRVRIWRSWCCRRNRPRTDRTGIRNRENWLAQLWKMIYYKHVIVVRNCSLETL